MYVCVCVCMCVCVYVCVGGDLFPLQTLQDDKLSEKVMSKLFKMISFLRK